MVRFKRRNPLSEKEAQREHFKGRFYERVGYNISNDTYEQLKNSIKKNGRFIHKGENGSVFIIDFRGVSLKVVYNIFKDSLITVLP